MYDAHIVYLHESTYLVRGIRWKMRKGK